MEGGVSPGAGAEGLGGWWPCTAGREGCFQVPRSSLGPQGSGRGAWEQKAVPGAARKTGWALPRPAWDSAHGPPSLAPPRCSAHLASSSDHAKATLAQDLRCPGPATESPGSKTEMKGISRAFGPRLWGGLGPGGGARGRSRGEGAEASFPFGGPVAQPGSQSQPVWWPHSRPPHSGVVGVLAPHQLQRVSSLPRGPHPDLSQTARQAPGGPQVGPGPERADCATSAPPPVTQVEVPRLSVPERLGAESYKEGHAEGPS